MIIIVWMISTASSPCLREKNRFHMNVYLNSNSLSRLIDSSECPSEEKATSLEVIPKTSERIVLLPKIYAEKLFPLMQKFDWPFMKVSRKDPLWKQNCFTVENSLLLDMHGNIFEKIHTKDKNGAPIQSMKNKGFVGKGGYKTVWDLKPLHINPDCPEMVWAKFHPKRLTDTLLERLKAFQKFKNEIHSEHLLIPETIVSCNSKDMPVIYQLMPKAHGGDTLQALKDGNRLSYLGWLRTIRDVGKGLLHMHEANCAFLDLRPENVMLMNRDRDNPVSKLCDFDLSRKFKAEDNSPYYVGTKNVFIDPKCVRRETCGFEDAKIQDQFSFGALLSLFIAKYAPRESVMEEIMLNYENQKKICIGSKTEKELTCDEKKQLDEIEKDYYIKKKVTLAEWVTEEDLNEIPDFGLVNEAIQNIIRNCCVGPAEDRPYRLPEFVATLDKVIDEYIAKYNAKPGAEYVFSFSSCEGKGGF